MNTNNEKNLVEAGIKQFLDAITDRLEARVEREIGAIPLGANYRPDGYVLLKLGKEEVPVVIEVKGHISNLHQVKALISFSKSFEGICVVIAELIENSIKEQLRLSGIGFFELGNEMFFPLNFKAKRPGLRREEPTITAQMGFRASSNNKILFYFIAFPESLNFTQRELSERLGISLGTVNAAIKKLEKVGSIYTTGNSHRRLGKFENIIDRWRISYLDFEKKKLFLGRFSPINENFYTNWKTVDLRPTSSYWGGEPAADLITKYLSPGLYSLYTYETRMGELLKSLRLKKDPKGKIEIFNAFWPEEINNKKLRIVPHFLIYSELVNSGIDRNKETANIIKTDIINNWENKNG